MYRNGIDSPTPPRGSAGLWLASQIRAYRYQGMPSYTLKHPQFLQHVFGIVDCAERPPGTAKPGMPRLPKAQITMQARAGAFVQVHDVSISRHRMLLRFLFKRHSYSTPADRQTPGAFSTCAKDAIPRPVRQHGYRRRRNAHHWAR